jgi:CBS domain-containing protein
MARYGYYDRGMGGGWSGGGERPLGGEGARWSRRGEELPGYRESGGWSRPEFNVSAGAFGGPGPEPDRWPHGWSDDAGDAPAAWPTGRWRTGEPWVGGTADADRVRVRDLMTPNPEAVTAGTSLAAVARRMRDLDVGIIPVVDDEERFVLQGVITDRDIAVRAAADGRDMEKSRVGDFMSSGVSSVQEGDSVRDVFSVMKRERVRRVPVTDFSGRLVGIIAQADLAVDYAALDVEREIEVGELLERISEPARPRPHRGGWDDRGSGGRNFIDRFLPGGYDREAGGRMRAGWRTLKREARHLLDRGYDRGYGTSHSRDYGRGWR